MTKAMLSRVPDDLHARVKQESGERGVSMSKIVEEALEMYLNSVLLAMHQEKNNYITFTIRNSDIHKVIIPEEDDETRLSDG